jgi:tetratricopeptide (TPR) repeat protein
MFCVVWLTLALLLVLGCLLQQLLIRSLITWFPLAFFTIRVTGMQLYLLPQPLTTIPPSAPPFRLPSHNTLQIKETSAILEVDRLNPDALLVHLGALTNARRVPELYQAAHQLAKISPKSAIAWYAVGCYYLASDQPEPARRYLVKACLADPLFVHAHIAVGLAHTAAHEGDQALQCFRESSRLFPGAHVANIAMGRELLRTGSPQLAERLLRSAQAPADSHVLNDLGVSLYEQGRLEAALTVFTQGLTLCRATFPRPRDDAVFVALCINAGHALRRLGRNFEALVHLEEAVATGSGAERVNARTTMGLVLLLMGRADAAVDVLHANLSGPLDLPQTNQACKSLTIFIPCNPHALNSALLHQCTFTSMHFYINALLHQCTFTSMHFYINALLAPLSSLTSQ